MLISKNILLRLYFQTCFKTWPYWIALFHFNLWHFSSSFFLKNEKKTISYSMLFTTAFSSSNSVLLFCYWNFLLHNKNISNNNHFYYVWKKYSHIFACLFVEGVNKSWCCRFFIWLKNIHPLFSLLTYELCHFKSWTQTHTLHFLYFFI